MICESCRLAGRFNAEANATESADDIGIGTALLRYRAAESHQYCTDANCPCAHVVGRVLNYEGVGDGR